MKTPIPLSTDLRDAIDGGEECRGRDSQLTAWADEAERLERIEQKYVNLCGVLNEQAKKIERLQAVLRAIAPANE